MNGLELRGLTWVAGSGQHTFDEDVVAVRRGGRAVVVATPSVAGVLADVVCGLARPRSGRILANGRDVTGGPPAPSRIALVPVGGALLPHLTVGRNIAFNLEPGTDAQAELVTSLARRLQLDGALALRPHRLSAEQRLRVAVARALGRWPAAVVIEDRDGQASCAQAARAAAGENVAVLVITDSTARAEAISARVYPVRPSDQYHEHRVSQAPETPRAPEEQQEHREATDDAVGADR